MVASFETIVGAANLDRSLEQTLDGIPVRLGVRPGTAEEVAACLAAARDSGAALVPTGGGSKLTQANVTRARSLVRLELSRLVEPLDVQLDEGIVTVGAGVRVEDLERAARGAGAQTRLTSLHPEATVGGTIAADPPDPECGLDRRLRSDLLGLTVALTNGELTRSGGKVVKNVTGLDLVRLYCGSCGTLGVITEATLRVWPLPEERVVLTRTVATLDTAIETARALEARRVDAVGLAILPDSARAQLVWTVEGSRLDVQERLGRIDGEQVGEEVWQQVRAEMASREGEAGRARVRVSARPSDTQELVRAHEAWSGTGPRGLVGPRGASAGPPGPGHRDRGARRGSTRALHRALWAGGMGGLRGARLPRDPSERGRLRPDAGLD